jgi:hypothetical protein
LTFGSPPFGRGARPSSGFMQLSLRRLPAQARQYAAPASELRDRDSKRGQPHTAIPALEPNMASSAWETPRVPIRLDPAESTHYLRKNSLLGRKPVLGPVPDRPLIALS